MARRGSWFDLPTMSSASIDGHGETASCDCQASHGALPSSPSVSAELARLQAALREAAARHVAAQEEIIDTWRRRMQASEAGSPNAPPRADCKDDNGSYSMFASRSVSANKHPSQSPRSLSHQWQSSAPGPDEAAPALTLGSRQFSESLQSPPRRFSSERRRSIDESSMMSLDANSVHLTAFSGLRSHDGSTAGSQGPQQQDPGLVSMVTEGSNALSRKYERLRIWLSKLKEPERDGPFAKFIEGSVFQTVLILIIVANGVFISHQTNYAVEHIDASDEVSSDMMIAELCFVSFFSAELAMKLCVHGWFFFIREDWGWNVFDACVVAASIIDVVFTYLEAADGMNVTLLRICRLFKLSKVFRMFRAFRFVGELRLLLKCVMGCFASLFWSVIMLIFFKFLFGLYFVQAVTSYMQESEDIDDDTIQSCVFQFGSVQTAMITLLKATTGGQDWDEAYEILQKANLFAAALFLFYIVFFMVAVWNIVTSVFVEKIMVMAAPNIEQEAFKRRKEAEADTLMLLELARNFDDNDSGTISWEEFVKLMQDEKFSSYFTVRGIDIKDGLTFYKMLSTISGTDEVPLELFVSGCLRCKGTASSVDLYTLEYEFKVMHSSQKQFQTLLLQQLNEILESYPTKTQQLDFFPGCRDLSALPQDDIQSPTTMLTDPSKPTFPNESDDTHYI